MKYIDRGGNVIDEREWYRMTSYLGIGLVLAETTLPHALGEITLRTVFVGVREDSPDLTPYSQAILPYRTMRLLIGRVNWETLQTYDKEADARAGHIAWVVRSTTSATGEAGT